MKDIEDKAKEELSLANITLLTPMALTEKGTDYIKEFLKEKQGQAGFQVIKKRLEENLDQYKQLLDSWEEEQGGETNE